ncbi:MAG: hypothetical protein JRG92_02465 [Deltaproteobacteria bacterium]|nr:hypothetical protein [Deltaproteobacteria bacterium]
MNRENEEPTLEMCTLRARRSRLGLSALLVVAALLATACSGVRPAYQTTNQRELSVEEAPLGGEALSQRKQDLERALGDMAAFHATMASLIDRRDGRGLSAFDDFVAAYMGEHLDPLLAGEWQSSHPEVMAVDANLRFTKADVLIQMRYPRRVQRVIDDIERRYESHGNMVVDYPLGDQNSITDALEILKNRKWEG